MFACAATPNYPKTRSGSGRALWLNQSQTIIAKLARISLAPVTRREDDVGHLARRREMQSIMAACARVVCQLAQEILYLPAEHCFPVGRVHAVTVEFDKDPIGTPLDCNRRPSPELKTRQRRRITGRQCAVLNLRNGQALRPLGEIQTERTLNHYRKNFWQLSDAQ